MAAKKLVYTTRQRRALDLFRRSLATSQEYRLQYRTRPRDFFAQFGHKFPPILRKLFDDVYHGRQKNVVVRAPRGGGKTFFAADIAFAKFYLQGWNVLDVAGALDQATILNEYVNEFLDNREVSRYAEGETRVLVTGNDGNWIRACASSQTAVRGKHARGRPMLLIIDEAALVKPAILRSALNTLTDASDSIVLYLSTHHEVTGRFAEMCDDPARFGVVLVTYDSFDVAAKCTGDCDHCFDVWRETLKPGMADQYTAEFRDHYCQGRAHKGEGHLKVQQIRAARVRNLFKEWFETENMGWAPSGEGAVIAPDKIKAAYSYDTLEFKPDADHWFGIDWGVKSMTTINVLQWDGETVDHLASTQFSGVTLPLIEEQLDRWAAEYCTREVRADSSHPFENQKLAEDGFDVTPVKFGDYKSTGIGWVRYLIETDRWRGLREFEVVIGQLLKWKYDKHGKPVKKDDHHPDGLLAGTHHINEGAGGRGFIGSVPLSDSAAESRLDALFHTGARNLDRLIGSGVSDE